MPIMSPTSSKMNVTGSSPIAVVQRPDESILSLRINQRITAEVLQVSGDQVVLDLDGTQVLAKLTSPDQSAALSEKKSAQFIVRDQTGRTLILQLVSPRTHSGVNISSDLLNSSIIPDLLTMVGLPVDEDHLTIARALLKQNLPITRELVDELKSVLSEIGLWGEREAQAAASLRAMGLVLSPHTIAMVLNQTYEPVNLILVLLKQLKTLSKRSHLSNNLESSMSFLEEVLIDWTKSPAEMVSQLRNSITLLGRPLEAEIWKLIREKDLKNNENHSLHKGWLDLILLRKDLSKNDGNAQIVEHIDRLISSLRFMHFMNTSPVTETGRDEWLVLNLPVNSPDEMPEPSRSYEQKDVKLKIAYRYESGKRFIDPEHTRLVIETDFNDEEHIEVDLSIVPNRIGVEVIVSNADLGEIAQSGLMTLEEGLRHLGYDVKNSAIRIREAKPEQAFNQESPWRGIYDLNVEV